MYLEYFSLERHPFRITPDPSLFFPGGERGRGVVLDALVYGITTGEGILKVVGEVGSGKTMLCRMLEEKLPPKVEIVYIANPNLSARDIVYAIAFELKLPVESTTDRLVVMHRLQEYLLARHADGASVVVFIEEAQGMPLETLEEIRLLSNLETHRHKLMQIVLFGQPELDRKLENKTIRQLRERITHSFHLQPLTQDEIREYLHFRLQQAGCPWPQLFSRRAEKLLASASDGLTRRINILADKALLAAYADPATRPRRNGAGEMLPMVLPRHVKTAIADSGYKRMRPLRLWPWLGLAFSVIVLAALGWMLFPLAGPGAVLSTAALPISRDAAPAQPAEVPVVVAVPAPSTESAGTALPGQRESLMETTAEPQQESVSAVDAGPMQSMPAAEEQSAAMRDQPRAALQDRDTGPAENRTPAEAGVAEQDVVDVATTKVEATIDTVQPIAESTLTPAAGAVEGPVAGAVAGLSGDVDPDSSPLLARHLRQSPDWLARLPTRTGFTLQLYSAPSSRTRQLESFLSRLEETGLGEQAYLCLISGNASRVEQWLVLKGEFAGLSEARAFVASLPDALRQYQPYVRNFDDIACANAGLPE